MTTNAGALDVLGSLGHPHSVALSRTGTGAGPHRQTLAPHRTAAHRGDLGRARRPEPHRHRRGRLGRQPSQNSPRTSTASVRRDQLTVDTEEAFLAHPLGRVLASLCGFGPRTGARTLAEIGDPHRFADGSHFAAYTGLAPIDWQSRRAAAARKPRGGNHRLNNATFTAAFVAAQHDPEARAYYQRKRSEGKRHNAAAVCVARHRRNIILAMLKTQTPYQPPHPENLPQTA